MANEVKISALPTIAASALSDIFPTSQAGVTYGTTWTLALVLLEQYMLALSGGTMTGSINAGGFDLTNLPATPGTANSATSKAYVDTTALTGTSVYAATAANLTVTQAGAGIGATLTNAGAQATFSIDSVTPPVGVNVLIKNIGAGGTAANYGIYTVTNAGSNSTNWVLTRSTRFDTVVEINNTGLIIIDNGATLAGQAWYNSATIAVVDTTAFVFSRFGTSGTVTSIAQGSGATFSVTPITSSGTISANQQNSIIGGNFDTNPWQRGVTFTGAGNGNYTADRFAYLKSGAGVADFIKTADAPTVVQAGLLVTNCLAVNTTTADASISAGDVYAIKYIIEGYDWAQIAQRIFTLSFWVKSTKTGIFCVGFNNSGNNRQYVAEYTINTTNTWEFKTITVSASPSTGTWDYTNGVGLTCYFTIAAGSDYQTTANAWNTATGAFLATSNQVNGMDSNSNVFKLDLIKIETGSVATGWVVRNQQQELALCQRYYEKSYNQGIYAGATTTTGIADYGVPTSGVGVWPGSVYYSVTKRAGGATVTLYDGVGASGKCNRGGNGKSISVGDNGDHGFDWSCSDATVSAELYFSWTADAEL